MKPSECSPRDWPLYFQGTFMIHDTLGFVILSCDDESIQVRTEHRGNWHNSDPAALRPCWPNAGAINQTSTAHYVGRRARREARRSSTIHHYYWVWNSCSRPPALGFDVMKQLALPSSYPTAAEALADLSSGNVGARAISHDLILQRNPLGQIGVICRGFPSGEIQGESGGYEYIPDVSDSPVSKRVLFKLQKEGVLCL